MNATVQSTSREVEHEGKREETAFMSIAVGRHAGSMRVEGPTPLTALDTTDLPSKT